jgi:Uma2 family endonuclease
MATAEMIPSVQRADKSHRFTIDDFHWMGRAGVFHPSERVELIEGRIIDMTPIGPFHGGVTDTLAEYFWELSRKRWIVRAQNPVQLDIDSEPQPDLVLARTVAHRYKIRHPSPEDVYLIIEVSDTTLSFDVDEKLPMYARAGIPEVWIVDLNEQVIRIHRNPKGKKFQKITRVHQGEFASPAKFPDVKVDVSEVFRRVD